MSALLEGLLDASASMPLLLLVKATLLLAVAGAATLMLRRRAAATRHLIWTLALAVLLILPVAAFAVPGWQIPVLTIPEPAVEVPQPAAPPVAVLPDAERVAELSAATGVAEERGGSLWPGFATAGGLLLLWAAGSAAVVTWLLVGRFALRAVLRRSPPVTGAAWDEAKRDAEWLLEVKRPVRLHRSRSAAMPVTWGVLRPVVLLPAEADSWSADRRRIVLLHELSHVARWDCLTQLLAGVACALYWFHPGVWYAARRMRVERELACDDLVLSAGTPAGDYATHLLELARQYRAVFPSPMVALHMARPNQLEGRLLSVLGGASGRRPPTRARVAVAALAAAVLTLPVSALQPTAVRSSIPPTLPDQPVADASRDSVIERDVTARAGETLVLDLRTGGTVEITSWDEDRVRVRARLGGRDWRESSVSVQRSERGVDVVAWQNADSDTETSHRFDIRVPRRFNVQLASAGGAVTIRNVDGMFRGHTQGGRLLLSQVKGEARLSTGGGDIRVSDSELSGSVVTAGGDVTMLNVSGDLRGSSNAGRAERSESAAPATAAASARAEARRAGGASITINDSDSTAWIVRRLPLSAAKHSIISHGHVALLLRDTTIVMQLTDRGLENIGSGDIDSEEDGFLAALFGSMLRGGLRMLLDRGIEYSLHDLREARYEDDRLVFESVDGNDVFSDVNVSGGQVMAGFDARQARAFAARVNSARARLRR